MAGGSRKASHKAEPVEMQNRFEGDKKGGQSPTDAVAQNRGVAADSPQLLSGAVESEEDLRKRSAGNSMLLAG
jgi:hypothetical protein